MLNIENNTITMVRGDTAKITLSIFLKDGTEYEVKSGDIIRFAAKKRYTDVNPVIEKIVDNETLLLQLDPEDTKPLGMGENKGKYVYDIQITQEDGSVDTFIRGTLLLLEEVE
jgi:hypothetical protein